MPKFSPQSLEKLATCDKDIQDIFNEVIRVLDCVVLEGYRDPEVQKQLFKAGKSKVEFGKHNVKPSKAIDVAPYPVDWNNLKRFYYFAGFVEGIAFMKGINLRWGGDWDGDHDLDDQSFNDLPHFELTH